LGAPQTPEKGYRLCTPVGKVCITGIEELAAKAVTDPRAAVAADVAVLRTTPALPGEWLVSGLVYDVATGLVDAVVPSAPLRDPEGIA